MPNTISAALLPPKALVRLAKLLALTSSSHDGEALNAARAADRLIREAGLTWVAFLLPRAIATPQAPARPSTTTPGSHVTAAVWALGHADQLSAWEQNFLTNLAARHRPLSAKQSATFASIVDRLAGAGHARRPQ